MIVSERSTPRNILVPPNGPTRPARKGDANCARYCERDPRCDRGASCAVRWDKQPVSTTADAGGDYLQNRQLPGLPIRVHHPLKRLLDSLQCICTGYPREQRYRVGSERRPQKETRYIAPQKNEQADAHS